MLRPLMLTNTLVLAVAIGDAQQLALPQELSTTWEVPPGDPLEQVVLLCCRCCQAPVGIFFPFLFWGWCPLVQSRLAALVDTQLRLTHVLPPMRVQTRSIPLALFPPLT